MVPFVKLIDWQEYKLQRFLKLLKNLYPGDIHKISSPQTQPLNLKIAADQATTCAQAFVYQYQYNRMLLPVNAQYDRERSVWFYDTSIDGISILSNSNESPQKAEFIIRNLIPWSLGYLPEGNQLEEDENYWIQAGLLFSIINFHYSIAPLENSDRVYLEYLRNGSVKAKIFADYCSDYYVNPWVIIIDEIQLGKESAIHIRRLVKNLEYAGNYVTQSSKLEFMEPHLAKLPVVYLIATENLEDVLPERQIHQYNALKVLLAFNQTKLPDQMPEIWDLIIGFQCGHIPLPLLHKDWQGWVAVEDMAALAKLLNIRVHAQHYHQVLAPLVKNQQAEIPISVVIATYHRSKELSQAIQSVIDQTISSDLYEIIIINNDPQDLQVRSIIEDIHSNPLRKQAPTLRLFDCPIPGLSAARNSVLAQASGKFLCFLDDDAIAQRNWLEKIYNAFEENDQTGVIGGHIYLDPPNPRPKILHEGLERFWSHFTTRYLKYMEVSDYMEYPWGANWCVRRSSLLAIGGFRQQYGRKKNDFSGGEEIIAASLIKKLGFNIAIEPTAVVHHRPVASRYTFRYLWHTIQTQIIIHYRMSRDLYLPRIANVQSETQGGFRFLKRCFSLIKMPNSDRKKGLLVEYFCLAFAWMRLFGEQARDTISRFRFIFR